MRVDVAVIGAGIAGAAAASALSASRSVCLIEAEPAPGFHASGRSATMFALAYGDRPTRVLAAASQAFLTDSIHGFATPRGMLHIASPGQEALLDAFAAETGLPVLDPAAVQALIPILRSDMVVGGVLDDAAASIDDHRLLQHYLRVMKAAGGTIHCRTAVTAIEASGENFLLSTTTEPIEARSIVNAAGAWADRIAHLAGIRPLDLQPLRRTAVIVDPPDGHDPSCWPMAIDIAEQWYFKPEAGRLLLSPADETLVEPHDVQPEEWDVAVAIDRYTQLTGDVPKRIHHRWAGLRTFAPDRAPVVGPDPGRPNFIWLAGQGGAGFMTAPAMAEIVEAILNDAPLPEVLAQILPDLSPARFHLKTG